jgi:NAD-dependent dihydropyrimidine dehydrogenase PreA subunit
VAALVTALDRLISCLEVDVYLESRDSRAPPSAPAKGLCRMTYFVTQPCIDELDLSCVDVCPVDCIHTEEGTDRMVYIDPDECIDCGACEPACPVTAIYAEDDLPDDQAAFAEINVLYFKDKDAARAKVPA